MMIATADIEQQEAAEASYRHLLRATEPQEDTVSHLVPHVAAPFGSR
jgi:hypothetical protein